MRHCSARTADVPGVLRALLRSGRLCGSLTGAAPASYSIAALAADVQRQAAQKTAMVFDLDALRNNFSDCLRSFPSHFVHALAIKSAPMTFMVDEALAAGLGIEAASFGEAASAVERGCSPAKLYFDSPAKTVTELRWALELGVSINADSLEELARIDAVLAERGPSRPSTSTIGLRINPIIDGGSIGIFAVSSSPDGKFGHPLHSHEARAAVRRAFDMYPWLSGLHAHVGSAGTSLPMLASGAATLVELAHDIDAQCRRGGGTPRVTTLDIGGGLATNMATDDVSPTFEEYSRVLSAAAPSLFTHTHRTVVTEFGRALTSKAGWIVTQVEYAKEPMRDHSASGAAAGANVPAEETTRTAICHAGADMMLRACYRPDLYTHRISTYDAHGKPLASRRGRTVTTHLAGPLCFAGDYFQKDVMLPTLEAGDFVVVHDAGANTLALWSRHCSRVRPPVYTYERPPAEGDEVQVATQLEAEPLRNVLEFWGAPPPSSVEAQRHAAPPGHRPPEASPPYVL